MEEPRSNDPQREYSPHAAADNFSAFLASIIQTTQDAIFVVTLAGDIVTWNPGAERLFGYPKQEVILKNIASLAPSQYYDEVPDILQDVTLGHSVQTIETKRRARGGELVDCSMTFSPLRNREGVLTGVSVIARNITERKNLEKEVLSIGDREKLRLAQDLHDSVGQILTGIAYKASALRGVVAADARATALIDELSENIRSAASIVREIARGLLPFDGAWSDIRSALSGLVSVFSASGTIRFRLEVDEDLRWPDDSASFQLFRIAQEAVTNAVRHAGASAILVAVREESGEIILTVEDDGQGLSKGVVSGPGLGIHIMLYRASLINAHLEILQPPEGGTRVVCRIPCSGPLPPAVRNFVEVKP